MPRLAQQRDVGGVDVAAVRREQPRPEESGPSRNAGGRSAVVPHHELDLGDALRQVNGVAEIVLLGEGADRLQQFGRRRLGERGGREHADASLVLAVPRREQIADALHALVAQLRREPRRLASARALRRHRAGDVLAVADRLREHAAQPRLRQRGRRAADAARVLDDRGRAGADRFERADGDHQGALLALKQARRAGPPARGVGKSEVLVEAALEGRRQVRVTVDQTGSSALPRPS